MRSYGKAKITPAFNLPSKFVPHTVGLIINKSVIENDCSLLADCYRSYLELAKKSGLKSVAFCYIITDEFRFQNQQAAEIAVQTVQDFLAKNPEMSVIFNVFKEIDLIIYQKLLQQKGSSTSIWHHPFSLHFCKKAVKFYRLFSI
nr:macro domain-containing protein [Haemophilus parahaemolyticus]